MWTSVSAITDADDCMRRWWLKKVVKIPTPQGKATIFGDVLHAVAERFNLADDRGLDRETGKPVELFPDGWCTMKNRWSNEDTEYSVDAAEEVLIKTLITKAITEGVLVREPNRQVEKEIKQEIYNNGYIKVILRGFMDLCCTGKVIDHKTAKTSRYILSKAKLKKSIQMMGYAYTEYLQGYRGNIWLVHNNFIKDFEDPKVIKRDVEVTQQDVQEFFDNVMLPVIKKMLKYYTEYPKTLVHKWRDVPGANNPSRSCNYHYGSPCPYIGICTGTCSFDTYLIRYNTSLNELLRGEEQVNNKIVETGDRPMSNLMDRIKREQSEIVSPAVPTTPQIIPPATQTVTPNPQVATTEPQVIPPATHIEPKAPAAGGLAALLGRKVPTSNSTPEPEPVAEPVEPAVKTQAVESSVAPWHFVYNGESCVACRDNKVPGFNSKMQPCNICDIRNKEAGRPTSSDYMYSANPDGTMAYTLKEDGAEMHTIPLMPEPTAKIELSTAEEPKPEATTSGLLGRLRAAEPVKETVKDAEIAPSIEEKTPLAAKVTFEVPESAPSIGYELRLGCIDVKGASVGTSADELLVRCLEGVSKVAGKDWSVMNHFDLMAAVDAYTNEMVKDIKDGSLITSVVPPKGTALDRMLDTLRIYATSVICPLAG